MLRNRRKQADRRFGFCPLAMASLTIALVAFASIADHVFRFVSINLASRPMTARLRWILGSIGRRLPNSASPRSSHPSTGSLCASECKSRPRTRPGSADRWSDGESPRCTGPDNAPSFERAPELLALVSARYEFPYGKKISGYEENSGHFCAVPAFDRQSDRLVR